VGRINFLNDRQELIIVREGIPFIILPLTISSISFLLGSFFFGIIFIVICVFMIFFFRNPHRTAPAIEGAAISPADGKVIEVTEVADSPYIEGKAIKISIFMSLFSVHVNRAPLQGRVIEIIYKKGRFRPAFEKITSLENQQNALIMELVKGEKMAIVQVAGVIARKISCWVKKGDMLNKGERFGLIRFGSRVDCYFPYGFELDCRTGQRVWGGETILGYMR
jgi:phosphatidylserine decarboxylase